MATITLERNTQVNDGILEIGDVQATETGFSFTMNDAAYTMSELLPGVIQVAPEGQEPYFVDSQRRTCSCPDFRYRCSRAKPGERKLCKHLHAVFQVPFLAEDQ